MLQTKSRTLCPASAPDIVHAASTPLSSNPSTSVYNAQSIWLLSIRLHPSFLSINFVCNCKKYMLDQQTLKLACPREDMRVEMGELDDHIANVCGGLTKA